MRHRDERMLVKNKKENTKNHSGGRYIIACTVTRVFCRCYVEFVDLSSSLRKLSNAVFVLLLIQQSMLSGKWALSNIRTAHSYKARQEAYAPNTVPCAPWLPPQSCVLQYIVPSHTIPCMPRPPWKTGCRRDFTGVPVLPSHSILCVHSSAAVANSCKSSTIAILYHAMPCMLQLPRLRRVL